MRMLKFAVVHAPTGPQEGPGLWSPDQAVDEAIFTGINDFPYGDAGVNKRELHRNKKDKIKPIVGIDFDGTVTIDPRGFRDIMEKVTAAGGECHLITGRPNAEAGQVKSFCKMYGLKFSSMNFYPIHYNFSLIDWDPTIDIRIASWKANVLKKLNANIMVDDSYIYGSTIAKKMPGIVILKPMLGGLI